MIRRTEAPAGPRSTPLRTGAALLLAPPLGAWLYGMLMLAAVLLHDGSSRMSAGAEAALIPVAALLVALFGAPLAYLGMVLVGIPSWLLLRWARAEGAIAYALCGFAGGFLLPPVKRNWSIAGESPHLHNAIAGALVLLVFWRIARRRATTPA